MTRRLLFYCLLILILLSGIHCVRQQYSLALVMPELWKNTCAPTEQYLFDYSTIHDIPLMIRYYSDSNYRSIVREINSFRPYICIVYIPESFSNYMFMGKKLHAHRYICFENTYIKNKNAIYARIKTDYKKIGKSMVHAVKHRFESITNTAVLLWLRDNQPTTVIRELETGISEGIAQLSNCHLVTNSVTTLHEARNATEKQLQTYGKTITALIASHDTFAVGSLQPVKKRQYKRKILIAGFGATLPALQNLNIGDIDFTFDLNIQEMLDQAFILSVELFETNDHKNDKRHDTPFTIQHIRYDRSNARKKMDRYNKYPVMDIFGYND